MVRTRATLLAAAELQMEASPMNSPSRFSRRLGALGVVFGVLFAAASALVLGAPSAGASAARVIAYGNTHFATATASVFLLMLAAIALVFFLGSLRQALATTRELRVIGSIVTVGGAVLAGGMLVQALVINALLDVAHYHSAAAAKALLMIASNTWIPLVTGLSAVTLGTGVTALRGGGLPRWLAWASIVLGVLAVAGPLGEVAGPLGLLWAVIVGITLFRSADPAQPTPPVDRATVTAAH